MLAFNLARRNKFSSGVIGNRDHLGRHRTVGGSPKNLASLSAAATFSTRLERQTIDPSFLPEYSSIPIGLIV
jgi:hypothetical protein